eukprot:2409109-Prymnesium_polylepis.1
MRHPSTRPTPTPTSSLACDPRLSSCGSVLRLSWHPLHTWPLSPALAAPRADLHHGQRAHHGRRAQGRAGRHQR